MRKVSMPDFKGFSTAKQKTQVYNLWTSGTPDRKSTSAAKVKKRHEKKGDSQKKEKNLSEKATKKSQPRKPPLPVGRTKITEKNTKSSDAENQTNKQYSRVSAAKCHRKEKKKQEPKRRL